MRGPSSENELVAHPRLPRRVVARRERLEHGDPVTKQNASDAHDAAVVSREKDVASSLRAAGGHRAAAEMHRRVAETLEQAGHDERAAWHRERADVDDAGSRDDDKTAVRKAKHQPRDERFRSTSCTSLTMRRCLPDQALVRVAGPGSGP